MTDDAPISEPEVPARTTRPGQPLAAELLTASPLPATTAGPAAFSPKLPPFQGD